eukprot:COSAG03_NODE_8327_length_813_cov_1.184874_2_plen_96_part_00
MTTTVVYMQIKLVRCVLCLAQAPSYIQTQQSLLTSLHVYELCQFEAEEAAAVDAARNVLAETGGTIKTSTLAAWSGAEAFSTRQMLYRVAERERE